MEVFFKGKEVIFNYNNKIIKGKVFSIHAYIGNMSPDILIEGKDGEYYLVNVKLLLT